MSSPFTFWLKCLLNCLWSEQVATLVTLMKLVMTFTTCNVSDSYTCYITSRQLPTRKTETNAVFLTEHNKWVVLGDWEAKDWTDHLTAWYNSYNESMWHTHSANLQQVKAPSCLSSYASHNMTIHSCTVHPTKNKTLKWLKSDNRSISSTNLSS